MDISCPIALRSLKNTHFHDATLFDEAHLLTLLKFDREIKESPCHCVCIQPYGSKARMAIPSVPRFGHNCIIPESLIALEYRQMQPKQNGRYLADGTKILPADSHFTEFCSRGSLDNALFQVMDLHRTGDKVLLALQKILYASPGSNMFKHPYFRQNFSWLHSDGLVQEETQL